VPRNLIEEFDPGSA